MVQHVITALVWQYNIKNQQSRMTTPHQLQGLLSRSPCHNLITSKFQIHPHQIQNAVLIINH